MTILDSILLGALQGATEFLPVSSSGHLLAFERILGVSGGTLRFNVAVHVGTLLAVCVALRREIASLLRGLCRRERGSAMLLLAIVLGSIPAAVAGIGLSSPMDRLFRPESSAALALVGCGWLFTALWLSAAEVLRGRSPSGGDSQGMPPGPVKAILIGLAQAVALLPGVSRSGMTIGAGVMGGMGRVDAARFSFLLSVPVIAGAGLLELPSLAGEAGALWPALAGAAVAAVTGFFAIRLFLGLARRHTMFGYAVYCALAGAAALLWWGFHACKGGV